MKKISRKSLVTLSNIVGRLVQLEEKSISQTFNGVAGVLLSKEGLEYLRKEIQTVIELEL